MLLKPVLAQTNPIYLLSDGDKLVVSFFSIYTFLLSSWLMRLLFEFVFKLTIKLSG